MAERNGKKVRQSRRGKKYSDGGDKGTQHFLDEEVPYDQRDWRHKRGLKSAARTVEALATMPQVLIVTPTDHFSHADIKGIDLYVTMDRRKPKVEIEAVRVQVRSSKDGIRDFAERIIKENGLRRGELRQWLTRERLIILNGQQPQEEIRRGFWHRYREMCGDKRAETSS